MEDLKQFIEKVAKDTSVAESVAKEQHIINKISNKNTKKQLKFYDYIIKK